MTRNRVILVVDDDDKMLEMLNRLLGLEGYHVATATDGESALSLFDKCMPDLVLLDIMMPGLDGYQILNLIRQRSNVPIVMVTAKCDISSLQSALAIGADDYVRKPFTTREIVARVRAKIRRAEQGII